MTTTIMATISTSSCPAIKLVQKSTQSQPGCIEFPPGQSHTYTTTIGDRRSEIAYGRSYVDRCYFVMRVQWFCNAWLDPLVLLDQFGSDWSIDLPINIDRSHCNSGSFCLASFLHFRHIWTTCFWQTGKWSWQERERETKVILLLPQKWSCNALAFGFFYPSLPPATIVTPSSCLDRPWSTVAVRLSFKWSSTQATVAVAVAVACCLQPEHSGQKTKWSYVEVTLIKLPSYHTNWGAAAAAATRRGWGSLTDTADAPRQIDINRNDRKTSRARTNHCDDDSRKRQDEARQGETRRDTARRGEC